MHTTTITIVKTTEIENIGNDDKNKTSGSSDVAAESNNDNDKNKMIRMSTLPSIILAGGFVLSVASQMAEEQKAEKNGTKKRFLAFGRICKWFNGPNAQMTEIGRIQSKYTSRALFSVHLLWIRPI
jgi:hypothetical protein